MAKEKYTVEASDGFYISRNGVGVLDLADPQDYEFANFVCTALNQAAQQKRAADSLKAEAICQPKKNYRKVSLPAKSG